MNRLTAVAIAVTASVAIIGPARADDPACYIVQTDPISQPVVSWDVDRPRRLTVATQLGETVSWVDGCRPTADHWTDTLVDARTYRLRPATSTIPVGPVTAGWPSSAPVAP